jgi:hypothetical protein
MALGASFPPPIYAAYLGLAPMLRYSDKDLMNRVSLLSFFPTTNPPSFVPTLTHSLQPCATQDLPTLNGYLKELNPFLRSIVGIGRSTVWPEFNNFVELCSRIANVIDAKKATLPKRKQKQEETDFVGMENGLDFALGPTCVAMKGEHWQEAWREQEKEDTDFIQRMYRNAMPANNFGWDDVGASGSEVQETNVLDYSLSYPPARTLDYCTIPDTY